MRLREAQALEVEADQHAALHDDTAPVPALGYETAVYVRQFHQDILLNDPAYQHDVLVIGFHRQFELTLNYLGPWLAGP